MSLPVLAYNALGLRYNNIELFCKTSVYIIYIKLQYYLSMYFSDLECGLAGADPASTAAICIAIFVFLPDGQLSTADNANYF